MVYRILAIIALILFLVLAANGHIHRWLGLETVDGTQAALVGGGSDIRAVEGWAMARAAAEACDFEVTDAVESLRRATWDEDPSARRAIAKVRKASQGADKSVFCKDAWEMYGPEGAQYQGLLRRKG